MTVSIKTIADDNRCTAVNIGALSSLKDYTLQMGGAESKGKMFLKDMVKATSAEVSLTSLPARTELPFFHAHKQNEEIYIFLKGSGKFQVDEDCFAVSEGSIVRIAPTALRSLANTSDGEMIYMVIQAKENSLQQYTMTDGVIGTPKEDRLK